MHKRLSWTLALVGVVVFAYVALPPFERWLLYQPSCFAFVGMMPPYSNIEGEQWAAKALGAIRDAAITQGAIRKPTGEHLLITRASSGDHTSVMSVTRTKTGWVVEEAAQLALPDQPTRSTPDSELPSSGPFKAAPIRRLDAETGRRLDALLAKRCARREPSWIVGLPEVWLGFYFTRYEHPDIWLIEIQDREGRYHVVRGGPYGVTGNVAALVIEGGQGFLAPTGVPEVDGWAHPRTGLP